MRRTATGAGNGLLTSQNTGPECPNTDGKEHNSITLYQKCINCPDYGTTCNGPKLAAMSDIMVVRAFHREIRNCRNIPMRLIYLAAQPISESTINDYFSHSEKDFKWTTVALIDNGLTAICGGRVGQPPLDHPCPATSSEIRQQQAEADGKLAAAEAECLRLQEKLATVKGKHIDQLNDIEQKHQQLSQQQTQKDQKTIDYLKELAEKRYQLILVRDKKITILTIIIAVLFALLSFYLVWDIMHPGVGLFRW